MRERQQVGGHFSASGQIGETAAAVQDALSESVQRLVLCRKVKFLVLEIQLHRPSSSRHEGFIRIASVSQENSFKARHCLSFGMHNKAIFQLFQG